MNAGEFLGCISLPGFRSVDDVFYYDDKLVVLGEISSEENSYYVMKEIKCFQISTEKEMWAQSIYNASREGEQRLISQVSGETAFLL